MNERERQRKKLERDIMEADYATQLLDHPEFKWYIDQREKDAAAALADITSDKYVDDHAGYLKRLAEYQAYNWDAKRLSAIATGGLKARQDLQALTNENYGL